MASVDRFVFLDDVQLSRQSWQTRNRIIVSGKAHFLIAHTRNTQLIQTIAETTLFDSHRWRKKMATLLRHEYSRHIFFSDLLMLIEHIENGSEIFLVDLNISIINFCTLKLGIDTWRTRSSALSIDGVDRTTRLIEICKSLECDTYLSPSGSSDYLADDDFSGKSSIKLEFFEDRPPAYHQRGTDSFLSHLSIIDLVANCGWSGSGKYIQGTWLPKESRI